MQGGVGDKLARLLSRFDKQSNARAPNLGSKLPKTPRKIHLRNGKESVDNQLLEELNSQFCKESNEMKQAKATTEARFFARVFIPPSLSFLVSPFAFPSFFFRFRNPAHSQILRHFFTCGKFRSKLDICTTTLHDIKRTLGTFCSVILRS